MKRGSIITGAATAAVLTVAGFAFSVRTNAADVARPRVLNLATKAEEVRAAVDHLKKARDLLSKADHDEKGHDYQALQFTEKAISEAETHLKGVDKK
jgi:hypothetical protein